MPSAGDIIVVITLIVVVALCIRSLWKMKKKGGCCGNCSACGGSCGGSCGCGSTSGKASDK